MLKYLKKYPLIQDNKDILIGISLIVIILIVMKWIIHKIKMKYLHENLLEILRKTISIFDKHNINYWAIGGTLLGSVREGRIIEHDDDADLGILKKDYLRINDLKEDFEKVGLIIQSPYKSFKHNKIMRKDKDNNYNENKIFIDIFPYELNENKYVLSSLSDRKY